MALSKMQLELEVDRCLRRFSENLKPSEEYHDTGVRLCEKVLITLGSAVAKVRPISANPFNLPIAYYGGTINRYTDPNPIPLDFKILIKVDNRTPPFTDVLDFIDTTLRNNAFRLQISPRTIKLTTYSISWTFTNGITVTMIPAVCELTRDDVFNQIKGHCANDNNRRYYSSTLVEKRLEFVKQQSFYAHKVGRLAKFWYQSMDLQDCFVNQATFIIDLLACAAVLEEEDKGHGREAVLRAFTRVVELIESMDKLGVAFEREYGQYGQWKVKILKNPELLPRLSEPNNPKLNILHDLDNRAIDILKKNGKAMMERLAKLVEKQEFCDILGGGVVVGDGGEETVVRPKLTLDYSKLFGIVAEDAINNNNINHDNRKKGDTILDDDDVN